MKTRELAGDLDALWGMSCSRCRPMIFDSESPRFIVWRRRRLLGIIPYRAFGGYIILHDFGEYWRVMLIDARHGSGPFTGADFRKGDAARLDAWKWTLDSRWLPIWDAADEREAFERIEASIKTVALNLPQDV